MTLQSSVTEIAAVVGPECL